MVMVLKGKGKAKKITQGFDIVPKKESLLANKILLPVVHI